jgi:hypothetical protein
MATFGEVLAAADEEFDNVVAVALARLSRSGTFPGRPGTGGPSSAGAPSAGAPSAESAFGEPAVSSAVARLARILTRYTGAIAGDFAIGGTAPPWHATARQADRSLREVSRLLSASAPAWELSSASLLARRLHRTGTALGCGLDLLDTHFATGRDGSRAPRSREALAIAAPDTALHLLGVVGRYSNGLSHLVSNEAPRRLLADVATAVREIAPAGNATVAVATSYRPPDRIPPGPGESVPEAVAAAGVSTQRMIRPAAGDPDLGSAATWHYTARSAAVVHDLARLALQLVAARLTELGAAADAKILAGAAKQVDTAGQAWRLLAATLENLSTPDGGDRLPLTIDAGDLVIRLGRLAHGDPRWRPGMRAAPVRPAKLVPGRPRAAELTLVVLRALDAFAELARAQHRQIVNAAQRGLLWTCGEPHGDPYAPIGRAHQQRFDVRFERIRVADRRAIRDTARAMAAIRPPQPGPAMEADLILRRHYIPASDDHPALIRQPAAADPPRHFQPAHGHQDRPGGPGRAGGPGRPGPRR